MRIKILHMSPHFFGMHAQCCSLIRLAMGPDLQVSISVDCRWVQDMLKGGEVYEMRVRLKEHRDERFPYKDDD